MTISATRSPQGPQLLSGDPHDETLLGHVHPAGHVNPTPSGRYNLVVVGAGTAGLVAAAGAAGLGAKVALVERHLLGGDCLNVGCIPSKGIISAGRVAATIGSADDFGIRFSGATKVDFPAVMDRMRRLRANIAPNDSVKRIASLGVDVYLGQGRFTGRDTVEVDGRRLHFAAAVIATGARAVMLPVPGLADLKPLTNETLFNLTVLPPRLTVIGAGPIGCEMAQTFRRLGSTVTIVSLDPRILPREDPDAADVVQRKFEQEGIRLLLCANIKKAEQQGNDKIIVLERNGCEERVAADEILIGVGRAANVEGLGLNEAGVDFTKHGVTVDDNLRTTNRRIYAAGDICSKYKFTHAADALARIVLRNALFFGHGRVSDLIIPWCTYTSPEVSHVGLYEAEATAKKISVTTHTIQLIDVDRAILDGETEGFARLHVQTGTDRILGATIVATHAGDMIGELVLAMKTGTGASALSQVIHPYPTQGEVVRKLGDSYMRTRLTPRVKKIMGALLRWRRS